MKSMSTEIRIKVAITSNQECTQILKLDKVIHHKKENIDSRKGELKDSFDQVIISTLNFYNRISTGRGRMN